MMEQLTTIERFVLHHRVKGFSDSVIMHALLRAGWPEQVVKESLRSNHTHVNESDYHIDRDVYTFTEHYLDTGFSESQIIGLLAHKGWSVGAIRFVLSNVKADHSQSKPHQTLLNNSKSTFLSKHTKHFFTKKKEAFHSSAENVDGISHGGISQAIAVEHKKQFDHIPGLDTLQKEIDIENSQNIPQTKLADEKKEIERLKHELELKQKELDSEERRRQDRLLSLKLDELHQAVLRNANNNQTRVVQQQDSAPSRKTDDEQVTLNPKTVNIFQQGKQADGQNSSVIVQPNAEVLKKSLDSLEEKFANLVAARSNTLAYTNPIIPEKLHLVTTPVGDRVQTGIPGLDPIIEGGLRRGTAALVGGGPGTGKSTFCLQYLVNGVLHYDEPGVYISFEETKQSIFDLGLQFNWDLQKLEDEKKLIVKEYTPEQIDKILESGGGSVRDLIDSIGAKRVVIDSITAFMLLYDGETSQRRSCLALFRALSKWGCTTLAVAEEQGDIGKHDASVLEYETAAVVLLYNERKGDLRQRSIEIFKMRGTKHAGRIFPMRINEGGIEVYPRENF